jgi:hypothetical protein
MSDPKTILLFAIWESPPPDKPMIIYLHCNQGLASVHNSFVPGAL